MAACSAFKLPTTVSIPGLGFPNGIFVLTDGTRHISTRKHTILQLPPSGRLATIVGNPLEEEGALKDGQVIFARFNTPEVLTVDRAGNVVVADLDNHVIRSVTKDSAVVSTLLYMSKLFFVYYESIKREPKIRGIYECRCDERLQTKTKKFTLAFFFFGRTTSVRSCLHARRERPTGNKQSANRPRLASVCWLWFQQTPL
jgi:hypothetical protein